MNKDKVVIEEIISGTDRRLEPLLRLYNRSFPLPVREDAKNIRKAIDASNANGVDDGYHFLAAVINGVPAGFVNFVYLFGDNLGFISYIVVDEKYRGRQIGKVLYQLALKALDKDAKKDWKKTCGCVLLEVEREDLAENSADQEIRQKRIRFFENLGARILPVDYWQPPLRKNEAGVRLHLMCHSRSKKVCPTKAETVGFLNAVYDKVY